MPLTPLRHPIRIVPWLALLAASAAWAAPEGVRLKMPPVPVTATDQFQWTIPIEVVNTLDAGIYADSLFCDVEDLDPGVVHGERSWRTTSNDLVKVMRSLSRLDSTIVVYKGVAAAEHARLTFHLYTHTTDGEIHHSQGTLETAPGPTSRRFKSEFLPGPRGRVEVVLVPQPWPRGNAPGLLLVHHEESHARRLLPLAWHLANQGFTVMLVSMPGYGLSEGAPDFAGPATVHALDMALDRLRRAPQVDSTRIAVWGISRGATAAALLACQRKDLAAVILQSGIYDPATAFRDTRDDAVRQALAGEAKAEGGWGKRSSLALASRMHAPVLFIHGDQDLEVPSNQAVDLAAKLRSAGAAVDLRLLPALGHAIPAGVSLPIVQAYLKQQLVAEP